MSATILGCGHTSHLKLFSIDVIVNAPQVHLHFLTDETEYEEMGYAKIELCCHGCGASTLVYYTNADNPDRRVQVRDEFVQKHMRCPNRSYQSSCPDWRTSFKRLDIRQKVNQWVEPKVSRRNERAAFVPLPPNRSRVRKTPQSR